MHCVITSFAQTFEATHRNIMENLYEYQKDKLIFKENKLNNFIDQINNNTDLAVLIECIKGVVENGSDAREGTMGKLNDIYASSENKTTIRKIKEKGRAGNWVVLIEGDSWFNFPTPLKSDLTKLLQKKSSLLIHTDSYGGDWYSNMFINQKYYTELSIHSPDAFIISGGGNDIVGRRLSKFVTTQGKNPKVNWDVNSYITKAKTDKGSLTASINGNIISLFSYGVPLDSEIVTGTRYLTTNFFNALVDLELLYKIMLKQIRIEEGASYQNVRVITQGYDYPIPRNTKAPFFCNPWRAIINRFLGTGKWLYEPMKIKGIDNLETQRKITKAMIFYFNQMLIAIAESPKYPNVYHIDSRGLLDTLGGVERARYWFDELHPKERPYSVIVNAIEHTIKTPIPSKKVIHTLDFLKMSEKERKAAKKKSWCGCFKIGD